MHKVRCRLKYIPLRFSNQTLYYLPGFDTFCMSDCKAGLKTYKWICAAIIFRNEMHKTYPHNSAYRIDIMPDFQRNVRRDKKCPPLFTNSKFPSRINLVMPFKGLRKNVKRYSLAMTITVGNGSKSRSLSKSQMRQ